MKHWNDSMIILDQIKMQFKDRVILEQVSLHVQRQQSVAIIGPSGAGKSLLLKIIASLTVPTLGTVQVQSNRISMLFQKNALFDSFTLLDNLLVPLEETLGIIGTEAVDRSMALLKAVGLESSAHLFPSEISGGMQKRLGIARSLIVEPEVILYDEPTAGLDPITSRSIADLILNLHRSNQTTLITVTNDLQRAYQLADVIYFCAKKNLQLLGSPSDVKATSDSEIRKFIFANALKNSSGTDAKMGAGKPT
jgi:phospholipid/cholesterol/gamma-HCH transport system ATP-binding protein